MFMSGPRRSLEYVYVEHVLQVDNPGFGFVWIRLRAIECFSRVGGVEYERSWRC